MAGEIKRSGFSDPESINLTSAVPPVAPTDFQVESWGTQTSNAPDELPYITFKWKAPANMLITPADGATDDVYTSGVEFALASGTYSTNDTAITLQASASTGVLVGDKITIGTDTTRYTIAALSGTALTILYGLLQDIVTSGASCKVLTKTAECPDTSRLITCDADSGDTVSFYAAYGFDYRLGWTTSVATLEWEDLDLVGGYLSSTAQDYYVKDGVVLVSSGGVAVGGTVITTAGDPTSQSITTSSTISFSNAYTDTFTIDAVAASSITLSTGLTNAVASGTEIWIHQTATFADYSAIDIDTVSATRAIGDSLGGYKLYWSSSVTGDLDPGTLWATLGAADYTVGSDGYTRYTLNATSHTWDGMKFYFSLSAIDNNVPANESTYDTSPWVITNPGQASIASATRSGTALTITYLNITSSGVVVSGTNNAHLYDSMGGVAMTQYSINGGYDIYLVEYTSVTAAGSYSGNGTASGVYINADLQAGDIVSIVDVGNQVRWVAHCNTAGQVTINNDLLTAGSNLSTYLGTGEPDARNFTVKYARITDRDTDSVLPLDGSSNKQYLTDFQSTHVVTLDANADQAVIIESIDTEAASGKEPV